MLVVHIVVFLIDYIKILRARVMKQDDGVNSIFEIVGALIYLGGILYVQVKIVTSSDLSEINAMRDEYLEDTTNVQLLIDLSLL